MAAEPESIDELITRQKKEVRALTDKHRAQLKRAKKADHGRLNTEYAQALTRLEDEHTKQRETFQSTSITSDSSSDSSSSSNSSSSSDSSSSSSSSDSSSSSSSSDSSSSSSSNQPQQKLTKAQKRRQKKEQEERERRAEIERLNAEMVDPKVVELEALNKQLEAQQLQMHVVPADGNCLFRAVQHQISLIGEGETAAFIAGKLAGGKSLRQLAAQHLREHRLKFQPFVERADSEDEAAAFEAYCAKVEKDGHWGSHLELEALSAELGCPFAIFSAKNGLTWIAKDDFPGRPPLYLTFHDHYCALGEHYNSVIPKISS